MVRNLFAASREFGLDVNNMRRLMVAVDSDERVGYKRGFFSKGALQSVRARDQKLKFR